MTDFNFIPVEFTAQLVQIEATWVDQPDAAQLACEALIATARAQREPLCQIYATELYGLIMNHKGQSVPARDLLYEAVQQAQALHNFPLEARVHEQIARSYYTAGDYRTALNHWLRSVELAELANAEATTWILAKIGLGQIYDALNDPATAVVLFQTAAARINEVNDAYLDAKIQINLGVVFFKCQRNAEAKQALSYANNICLRENFYDYSAESNFRLAEVFIQEAELNTAMALLEQALIYSRKAKHSWSEANIYSALAQIHAQLFDWEQALQLIQIGQNISRKNDFLHVLMRQYLAAAEYAEQLQQLPLALAQFKAGFELQQKINAAAQPDQHQELEQKTGMRANASNLLLDLANHPAIEHGKLTEFPQVICQAATQILAIARVGLWQRQADRLHCVTMYLHDAPISEIPLLQQQMPTFFNWLSEHKSLIAHDALHHPDAWDLAEHYLLPRGIHSILAFPILSGAEQYVLLFEHLGKQRNWLPDEVQHASQLADISSRALANHERHSFQSEIHLLNARLIEANDVLETRVAERTQTLELAMDKLVQSEKLAALGSLVAGIAHELNTPLGAALTCSTTLSAESRELRSQMLSNTLKKSSLENYAHTMVDASELIERNINRAIELVCDFKQVAVDTASSRRRKFDLLGTVNEIVKMFNGQIRHTQHQLSIDIPANIRLDSYPGPFEQVIGNLINNSLLHGFEKKSAGLMRLSARQTQAGWVDLCFEDNGCGIKTALHKKVFEPFYTTKLGQGGSGLGMYITYNIITGVLGGELTLESEAEQYTRFNIKLPLVAPLLSDTEKNTIER